MCRYKKSLDGDLVVSCTVNRNGGHNVKWGQKNRKQDTSMDIDSRITLKDHHVSK